MFAECGGLVYLAAKVIGEGMAALSTNMQQAMQQAQQMQEMQEAETTAEAFLEDSAGGFVDVAYARTSRGFQTRQTLPQFRAFVNQNPALQKFEADSLDEPKITPQTATFAGTLPGPNGDVAFTLVLIKDGPMWKVDRFTIP